MTVTNAILSTPRSVPDTLLPFLDTIYRGPRPQTSKNTDSNGTNRDHSQAPKESRWSLKDQLPQGIFIQEEQSILQTYATFVAALTGQDEVAFYATTADTHICHAQIAAASQNHEPNSRELVSLNILDSASVPDAALDFSINLYGDRNADQSRECTGDEEEFALAVEVNFDASICEISLQVACDRASFEDATYLLRTFLQYIHISMVKTNCSSKIAQDATVGLSILNFPPRSRPPPFPQDQNQTPKSDPLLHRAFERRAAEHPDRIALDYLRSSASQSKPTRETYSYRQLNRLADDLATSLLASIGSRILTGPRAVPILLSTSPDLYISYLAVLKAGLAFCPLPTDAPTQRLQDIIDDLNPQVLLGAESFSRQHPTLKLRSGSANTISSSWIDVEEFISRHNDVFNEDLPSLTPSVDTREHDICYVMYTSGSTGKPKGVQITHLAASCSIASHSQRPLPPSADGVPRWFQFAAPTFDPSLMEIFVTLSTGSTLCSASRHLTLSDLESTVSELGASVMMSTPSMAALLRPSKMPSLRSLWTMGETLLRRNIEDFAANPKTELCNAYGPTEGAINCTLLPSFHPEDRGSIIGPALPTCSLFILDANSTIPVPVPRGFVGELAIGGPQVSIGYLNRPEQNAKSFIESAEFGRLYRTGDKARIVTDRNGHYVVEFLGRIDDSQVKLSGRRVDLGEIDAVLTKCRGVKEAVTVSYKQFADQAGSEEAVAFIVLDDHGQGEAEPECREAAARQLPSYMCPTKYFFLDKIPRSSAGKVDRKALRALVDSSRQARVARKTHANGEKLSHTPGHDLELHLCSVLSEVLGCTQISPTTKLFSVGVDSLRAVRYLQRLRDSGVNELGIVDVLRNATPRALADLLLKRRKVPHENGNEASSISRLQQQRIERELFYQKYQQTCADHFGVGSKYIENILPTTATQSGMLASFLRGSLEGISGKNYIYCSVHHINSSVDIQKLQKCWNTVLRRHDAYRMVFLPIDDTSAPFLQCVLSASCRRATKAWKEYDLETDDNENFQEAIRDALLEAEKSISLDRPPLEMALVTTPTRKVITCSLFHALFDGASLQLLFEEVTDEYSGAPTPSRTEISTAVDMHFTSDTQKAIDFWAAQMEDCEPAHFPNLTGLRPEVTSKVTKTTTYPATFKISALRSGAANAAASPLAILQAAWSLLLITYNDSWSSSAFGSVVSGRLDSNSELCVGPTFTTIPITIPAKLFQGQPYASNASILQHLTELNAKSLEHLQIPLNSVLAPGGRLHYDTLLAYQDFASGTSNSELWNSVEYPAMGNDFAVMIEVWPEPDGSLRLRATYTDEYLDGPSVSLMLQQFNDNIAGILQHPERPYLDGRFTPLPQLPSKEFAPEANELDQLLHGPFESQVKQNPEDLALIFKTDLRSHDAKGNIEWTYRELDLKANRLASHLTQTFGCLRDLVVPFSLEKSPELYVAILGILKAGAAWCPIDPVFPADRRRELITRTDAKMLLVANNTLVQDDSAIPEGVILIDLNSSDIEDTKVTPNATLTPHDMAYLIWTSGTTGLPKGVMVEHHSAAAAMKSLRNLIHSDDEGTVRCLQFSQPTFDVFVQDLFYTWGLGGIVISATKDTMLGSFPTLANETNATHVHLTPAFAAAVPRNQIKTLQVVTFIGEALSQTIADDWGQNMIAYNTYGPAEVSVVSTVRQFAGCANNFKSVNVGFTLPSVSTFVINDDKIVIKQGVGELALAGPQVARGYWKDSTKTQEKFHWNKSAQAHVYMTGDIVRQLHDGSFEFVGRRDDLVKLNGMRVELSEISFALGNCHPDVEQVVTMHMARPNRPTKVVVVFLSVPSWQEIIAERAAPITHAGASELANVVWAEARRTLPEHMVPSVIIVLGSIPMTASAKIDRIALSKAYESLDIEAWENVISPAKGSNWTELEATLLEQVAKFSGTILKSINRTSRLAALGIDSIGAIRFAARLKIAGYALSTADLLKSRTVGDLCQILSRLSSEAEVSSDKNSQLLQDFHDQWHPAVTQYLKAASENSFFVCPSLPMQENLLSETFRNPQTYWSNHFFELSEHISISALEKAWKLVASQNDALRIGFIPTAALTETSAPKATSTFVQAIFSEPSVDFSVVEVTSNKFVALAKQRALAIALKRQENSFLQPCWAITTFDRGGSMTMMFSIHHSIHDGPSLSFIMHDLKNVYESSACALESRHQLREAVTISTSSTEHDDIEDSTFWEQTLQDFVAAEDDIGEDKGKPKTSSGYNTATVHLSASYTDLQAFTQHLEISSITSLLRAAWGCTVADFLEADNKNVVLGEVLSERALHPSLDDVIGPLVTLVPAPVRASGNACEIVKKHDKTMIAAWKHRNINPGALRRLIKRPKHQPLYPAVFVFHPHADEENDHALWIETDDIIGLNVEHELTLNVEERADGSLDLVVSAESSTLGLDRVELLTKQLDALITSMVKHPVVSISELTNHFPIDLLSKGKSRQLIENPIVAYDNPLCWFEHWAQVSPDWPAAEIAEQIEIGSTRTVSWTFYQLNHEANLVCAFIHSLGVRGRMIGICLGRTLTAFAVTVGIFKSGNTYLPIDEDLPKERKTFLLHDSNAAIFFTHGRAEFTPPDCRAVDVDNDQYKLENASSANGSRSKDDIAYLLYTSGSTGNPKGVLISNSNLTAFCEAQSEFICHNAPATLTLGGTGKWLGLASRAFDVHVAEMFLAWRHGLCAVTGKRSMLLDDLAMALKELRVTHASFVPSLLDQVGLIPADVPILRFMSVGGEKISQRTLEAWGDSQTVPLVNAYGPTECTIGCCSARVSSKSNMRNIGNPLGDSIAHVLVPGTLTYAKRGMEGELCFTGSLVGIGYHNRDTGDFVEDFHSERMYRTGDLVRMMPDGSIEIFGRSDDQTKIRGQRLELGEVSECARCLSPDGTYVTSLITKHPDLSRMQLVSFVARSRSGSGNEEPVVLQTFDTVNDTIRSGCKERLPSYMVPDVVVPLSFLPLASTSGKADVKLLKKIFSSIPLRTLLSAQGSPSSAKAAESRELNEDEKQITELLKAVLRGTDAYFQPSTNIFEVGVDSLVAISLATLMRKHGYDCTVADVLSTDTISDLALLPHASILREQEAATKARAQEKLSKIETSFRESLIGIKLDGKVAAVRPCLPVQEAVVAKSLDKEGGGTYVNHIVLELFKQINISKFKQTWEAAIRDNEILRTCFCQVENNIIQVVLHQEEIAPPWTETSTDQEDRLMFLKGLQDDIAREMVNKIDEMPPIRLLLLKSDGSSPPPLFCVSMHHALYDAEALSMLLSDVYSRYIGLEVSPRPSSESLIERFLSFDENSARQYWTEAFQDYQCPAPPSDIQIDIPAKLCTRTLKTNLASLEAKAASLRVTLPTLAQTAFGIAMAKASSVNDFVCGLVLSGRSIPVPDVENILAPTITTVPQRIDLRNSSASILDVLASVQKSSGKMLQFQHTSLRAIHKWAKADHPLFNCLSSYVKPGKQPSYEDVWTEVESYMPPDYPFAVEFEANAESNELIIRAGYTSDFGTDQDVANLLEMVELLIDTISPDNAITIKFFGIESKGHSQAESNLDDHCREFSSQEQQIRDILLTLGGFESEHISRHSTFFRLGVDSVIAIRFAQQLRAAGLRISSSDIARYPSIAQLSAHISTKNQAPPQSLPINYILTQDTNRYRGAIQLLSSDDSISQIYACTPLQTGLLTQTVASGGVLYVHHPTVQLADNIDLDRLKNAWVQVLSSLDILRTSFHYIEESEARWIAAVHEHSQSAWDETVVDKIEEGINNIVASTIFPSPKSFSTPPVKVTILGSGPTTVMVLSLHHSLYDGWSLPFIFERLSTAYTKDEILPKTQFSTAAKLITERQQGSVDFWLERLENYIPSNLPASGLRAATTFSKITIGLSTTDVLERCKAMNVNLQSVALLAYGKALCCLVQRRDIVFGHVVSGRTLPVEDVEQIVGPLFNTIPFRIQLSNPLTTNEDVVREVQQVVVDGQEYQHASLNTIQKLWRQSQKGSDTALIHALFVFQKATPEDSSSSSELWTPFDMEDSRDSTEYGLNVEFEQGELELTLSTASSRLNPEDLDNFCLTFDQILQDILNVPSRSVTAYPKKLQGLPVSTEIRQSKPETSNFYDIADTPALFIVRKAFSDVSQIPEDNIRFETSIFSLGIDSIAAIRVASICREQGIQLSVADILQGRCVGGIVRILMSKTPDTTGNGTSIVEVSSEIRNDVLARLQHPESSVEQIMPCLAGQVYHLSSWLISGRTFYEPTWALRSRTKLDADALRGAWSSVQQRYAILRTVFVAIGPYEAYQVVLKPDIIGRYGFALSHTSQSLVDVVKQEVKAAYASPSTLLQPPISLHLIQGKTEDVLLTKLHHSLYDAWTMTSFIGELSDVYGQRQSSSTPSFPDFIWHTRDALAHLDESTFWKSILANAEPTILSPPTAKPTSSPSLKQTFVWVRSAVTNLKEKTKICQTSNLALSTVVIQAFARVIGQCTKTSHPTFGFFHTGRSSSFPGTAQMFGPCVNLLPMTISSKGQSDLKTALNIQENLSDRVPFEQSYLRDILCWKQGLDPSSPDSHPQPLFNASLNLLWHGKPKTEINSEQVKLLEPMDIGVPTDFASEEAIPGETAIDGLEIGYLAKQNLFVDVGPVEESDSIDFGVKCEFSLMDEEDLRVFVGKIGEEVERIVGVLGAA
ncbi:related to non-ribosomal peptide synthetase [Phialocephala subalpina]|uniref:Related to non-ribosomal peptide synthetase n=1 Tax=Phialocephala subalpina TaxID=576137 RepID=A0A1L7WRF5_9HELO|nr:related to non-ribosomal peptide synthetase [Phialocephala subalpina]